jgi:hypothetical protein
MPHQPAMRKEAELAPFYSKQHSDDSKKPTIPPGYRPTPSAGAFSFAAQRKEASPYAVHVRIHDTRELPRGRCSYVVKLQDAWWGQKPELPETANVRPTSADRAQHELLRCACTAPPTAAAIFSAA